VAKLKKKHLLIKLLYTEQVRLYQTSGICTVGFTVPLVKHYTIKPMLKESKLFIPYSTVPMSAFLVLPLPHLC